jgi:hypothetical protein
MLQISENLGPHRRGISFDEFESRLVATCEAHRAQGRALAFAFILFDRRHAHFRRMLEQDAYWEALHELSGRNLSVFSFDLRSDVPRSPNRLAAKEWSSIIDGSDELPADRLSEYFDGLRLDRLPCVLFFQVDGNQVVGSFGVRVSAEGIESAYNDLSDVLNRAVSALAAVDDEHAQNAQEVYQLLVGAMDNRRVRRRAVAIYRAVKTASSVAGIAKFLQGFL